MAILSIGSSRQRFFNRRHCRRFQNSEAYGVVVDRTKQIRSEYILAQE